MDTTPRRVCSICGIPFPATRDYFNVSGKYLRPECKTCRGKKRTEQRLVDIERVLPIERERNRRNMAGHARYKQTDKYKQYSHEYNQRIEVKARTKQRMTEKPEIHQKAMQKYQVSDKGKATKSAFNKKHPEIKKSSNAKRRALLRNGIGTHTPADIRKQYQSQDGKCFYCKELVGITYHIDHYIPLSKGGYNWPDNLVIACPHCNLTKHTKIPQGFEPNF